MTRAIDELAGMRILLINWRDRRHPLAGGAEVYCHEVAQRFAAAGAEVTLLTSAVPGALRTDSWRGVDILRRGGTYSLYFWVALHLIRSRRAYDAILDCQNGIPFFSPLFTSRRTAVALVIHHVHQDQFSLRFPWPLSAVGRFLEGPASRLVYGPRPVVAVSPSTRRDIRSLLRLKGPVYIVPNGVSSIPDALDRGEPSPAATRSESPRIAVVSRLVPHKRLHLLLEVLEGLRSRWPQLAVDVAGTGPQLSLLQQEASRLGVEDVIAFHGYVTDARRQEILEQAWLTVCPSQAEGWGLTVLEANAVGIPAVAFSVPGLRDAIVDGVTGWLVPPGGSLEHAISEALDRLADPETVEAMRRICLSWSASFTWDATADRLAGILLAEVSRQRNRVPSRRLPSDIAVRVDLSPTHPAELVDRVSRVLRRTDVWRMRDDRLSLLLMSCDEAGAERVVDRLGAVRVLDVAIANGGDLLVGAGP